MLNSCFNSFSELSCATLTTQIVASPLHRVALVGAHMGVGSDGGAETLAVSTLGAGTGVVDTPLQILGVVLHSVAGGE